MANRANVQEILARVSEVTGAVTNGALARELGVLPQTLSNAKRRGQIPDEWLYRFQDARDYRFAWLKYGQEPRLRNERTVNSLPERIRTLVEKAEALDETGQELLLDCAELYPQWAEALRLYADALRGYAPRTHPGILRAARPDAARPRPRRPR